MLSYKQLQEDFKRLIENNKLSHAYLFFGENENEKIVFAQALANFLENKIFEKPTKLLKETLIISTNNNAEDRKNDPRKSESIGIDDIRFLKNFLWQKPTSSSRRIVIITKAEYLTPQAQNAALKIVEEPPASALIIFIVKNYESLLPTLSSRLQKIYFPANIDKQASNPSVKKTKKIDLSKSIEKAIEDNQIDDFFKNLISQLAQNPIKNSRQLKEVLNRLTLIKQLNTNKKLQLRALKSYLQN